MARRGHRRASQSTVPSQVDMTKVFAELCHVAEGEADRLGLGRPQTANQQSQTPLNHSHADAIDHIYQKICKVGERLGLNPASLGPRPIGPVPPQEQLRHLWPIFERTIAGEPSVNSQQTIQPSINPQALLALAYPAEMQNEAGVYNPTQEERGGPSTMTCQHDATKAPKEIAPSAVNDPVTTQEDQSCSDGCCCMCSGPLPEPDPDAIYEWQLIDHYTPKMREWEKILEKLIGCDQDDPYFEPDIRPAGPRDDPIVRVRQEYQHLLMSWVRDQMAGIIVRMQKSAQKFDEGAERRAAAAEARKAKRVRDRAKEKARKEKAKKEEIYVKLGILHGPKAQKAAPKSNKAKKGKGGIKAKKQKKQKKASKAHKEKIDKKTQVVDDNMTSEAEEQRKRERHEKRKKEKKRKRRERNVKHDKVLEHITLLAKGKKEGWSDDKLKEMVKQKERKERKEKEETKARMKKKTEAKTKKKLKRYREYYKGLRDTLPATIRLTMDSNMRKVDQMIIAKLIFQYHCQEAQAPFVMNEDRFYPVYLQMLFEEAEDWISLLNAVVKWVCTDCELVQAMVCQVEDYMSCVSVAFGSIMRSTSAWPIIDNPSISTVIEWPRESPSGQMNLSKRMTVNFSVPRTSRMWQSAVIYLEDFVSSAEKELEELGISCSISTCESCLG